MILDFSLTYNIVDESAGDIADFLDAIETSWAETLRVPKKEVTATVKGRRRALVARALDVSVEARLNEGDSGVAKRRGIIDKSLVALAVDSSPVLKKAMGLPADEAVTVESIKDAVSVTELPTLARESDGAGAKTLSEILEKNQDTLIVAVAAGVAAAVVLIGGAGFMAMWRRRANMGDAPAVVGGGQEKPLRRGGCLLRRKMISSHGSLMFKYLF